MLNPYHLSPPPHEYRASPHINNMSHKFQLTHKFHMPNFHNTHHSIQESCHIHMAVHHIYIYIHLNIQAYPSNYHSIQGQQSNQTTFCLAQPLAQAEEPRSSETVSLRRVPLRLGEGSKQETGTTVGSRLGETPLAWASGSLAQTDEQVAWATFREIGLGEPPPDSLGRGYQFSPWSHLQQIHHLAQQNTQNSPHIQNND